MGLFMHCSENTASGLEQLDLAVRPALSLPIVSTANRVPKPPKAAMAPGRSGTSDRPRSSAATSTGAFPMSARR
jgi:hypothetical protein